MFPLRLCFQNTPQCVYLLVRLILSTPLMGLLGKVLNRFYGLVFGLYLNCCICFTLYTVPLQAKSRFLAAGVQVKGCNRPCVCLHGRCLHTSKTPIPLSARPECLFCCPACLETPSLCPRCAAAHSRLLFGCCFLQGCNLGYCLPVFLFVFLSLGRLKIRLPFFLRFCDFLFFGFFVFRFCRFSRPVYFRCIFFEKTENRKAKASP